MHSAMLQYSMHTPAVRCLQGRKETGIYITKINLVAKVFCVEYSLSRNEVPDMPYRLKRVLYRLNEVSLPCSCYT